MTQLLVRSYFAGVYLLMIRAILLTLLYQYADGQEALKVLETMSGV